MYYESEERAVLLFCSYNQSFFRMFSFFSLPWLLKLPIVGDGKAR